MYDAVDRHGLERERQELLKKIAQLEEENAKLKSQNNILHKTIQMLL